MRRARRARSAVSVVVVVAGASLLAAAPASAAVVYSFQESLGGTATPAGSFAPSGLAVDPTSHDLYVSDSAHKVIDKQSSVGSYLCQITGAGSASVSASECDKSAAGPGAFASASGQGIVGAGGTLYFPDTSAHAIDRFSAAGAFISPKLPVPASGNPAQVALDAAGNLYVADPKNHVVDKYTTATSTWSTFATGIPAGSIPAGNFDFPGPVGVAVDTDPSSLAFGDVYVADPKRVGKPEAHAVDVFAANGTYLSQITATPAGPLSASLGKLAVDPTDGNLFVPDIGNGVIDEFAPGGAFIARIPVPSVPATSSPQAAAIDPGSGTLYVADKANEVVDVFSATLVPTVITSAASAVEETAATLSGEVDPAGGGEVTECEFQYVEAAAYQPAAANPYAAGATVPCSPLPPLAGAAPVSAGVASLSPGTAYHYRLLAANANAIPSLGEDRTFSTTGAPVIEAGSENSLVSGVAATLKAKIDPLGLETSCQVQYLTEADFLASGWAAAQTLPCSPAELSPAFGAEIPSARLEGLAIATTYHYRFLAANSALGGTATGEDKTFLTFGIHSVEFQLLDAEGHPDTEAGGHPYELSTGFEVNWTENAEGEPFKTSNHPGELLTGNVRTVITELPPGLVGNPSATPRCTRAEVARFRCAAATQVGELDFVEAAGGEFTEGLFNLVPPKGVVAEFGANIDQHLTAYIDARLRPDGTYAVTAEAQNNSTTAGLASVSVHLWGVPADPVHDAKRCAQPRGGKCAEPHPAGTAAVPLLLDPTSCDGPLTTVLAADSYQAPGLFDVHPFQTPPITGCNQLDFAPTLEARPTTDLADSPSGLSVDLHIPQKPAIEDPAGKREADLRDTVVALPQGLDVNPAAATGLEACSPAQIGLETAAGQTPIRFSGSPAQCPDASKIGTVELLTPLLTEEDQNHNPTGERPLPGSVYLAAPHDNPFDSLLALYIALEDPRTGVIVKLAGHVEADPQTGQLTATFAENPQLPFEDFKLKFFGGAHSTLRTPATCGNYRTTSVMTPWSAPETGPPATPSDPWQISQAAAGGACPTSPGAEPNAPAFEAGTETPAAGAFSPFVLHLSRADGSQELKAIDTTLPPGLTGKLAGIPYCPEAGIARAQSRSNAEEGKLEQADPSCPAASQVGTVTVGAGSGPSPFYVTGHAYWAGPYKGAPLSMVIVTPAVAGPFDLGTVVVRVALQVDPETARIHAVSDPLPTILDGIPLDVRSISLKLDRPDFTLNPTSCEKMAVTGSALSTQGNAAALTSPFQVGGCKSLGFKPHLKIQLKGQTRRVGHPALKATLTARPGEANIARAQVNLPGSEFLDQGNLNKTCTKPVLLAGACPANTVYGTAKAWTPLLEKPLEGPVYLVGGYGYKLPALVAELNGQIRVLLVGKVDSGKNKGIRNTFEVVPDAPVEKFVLEMKGGPKYGLLENSKPLCEKPQKAIAEFTGQNGVVEVQHPKLITDCGKGHKGKKHHKAKKAGGKHHHPGH